MRSPCRRGGPWLACLILATSLSGLPYGEAQSGLPPLPPPSVLPGPPPAVEQTVPSAGGGQHEQHGKGGRPQSPKDEKHDHKGKEDKPDKQDKHDHKGKDEDHGDHGKDGRPQGEGTASPPAASGHPPAPVFTLADLEQIALKNNPTLAQADLEVEAARGRAVQAGLYPNPTVGYNAEQIGLRGRQFPGEQQGIFVDQLIVTAGKLHLNRAKYDQEAAQMQWQALAQKYRVVNGVRLRFYQLLAMCRLLQVRAELVKVAEDIVGTVEELYNVGQANEPDVLQARIEARQERVALENARALYLAAWQQLAAFVGEPHLHPGQLQGDLEQGTPIPDFKATLAHLLEASPEVQVARSEVERNRFGLQREEVEPIPNIQLRNATGYNFSDEARRVTTTVQVGVRLPLWDKNQGNIQAAKAQLGRSLAEVGRVELSLQKRLARAYGRYLTARALVENYGKYNVPDSRRAFQLYLASFRQRRAAYPQVLIAQRNYFQIASDYVEALDRLRRTEVEICGLLLVDGLDEPPGPPGEGRFQRRDSERPAGDLPDPISGGEGRTPEERIGNQPGGL